MTKIILKNRAKIKYKFIEDESRLLKTVSKHLSDSKVIGWFQKGSEFGPRSLGHRSILADPRRVDIQKHINAKIKFREDFRPFAPSVLAEDVNEYFEADGLYPYMLMTALVKTQWKDKIPGVVHKDNSCRIQTVTPDWNHRFYHLLKEFKKKTSISVLLNTSFNKKGMPIVETPTEALDFFFECELDYLVMDNYIISK